MTNNREEHINACSGCPYAIWEEPEPVAGFMFSMCGVRVGNIGMAAELDIIGEKLSGVERFTKNNGDSASKLEILKQIKAYTEKGGWKFEGFSKKETIKHIGLLIEFCGRTKEKELSIRAWA